MAAAKFTSHQLPGGTNKRGRIFSRWLPSEKQKGDHPPVNQKKKKGDVPIKKKDGRE